MFFRKQRLPDRSKVEEAMCAAAFGLSVDLARLFTQDLRQIETDCGYTAALTPTPKAPQEFLFFAMTFIVLQSGSLFESAETAYSTADNVAHRLIERYASTMGGAYDGLARQYQQRFPEYRRALELLAKPTMHAFCYQTLYANAYGVESRQFRFLALSLLGAKVADALVAAKGELQREH